MDVQQFASCPISLLQVLCPKACSVLAVRRLMSASGVRRGRAQRESVAQAELLDEFAAACTRITFRPPLTVAESVFLQNLQSER